MINNPSILRVLIADDDPGVRSAVQLLLQENAGLQMAGASDNAKKLLDAVKSESPDLVLLDWELPGLGGADLVRDMRSISPGVLVIVLHSRPIMRKPALAAGADDFVSKGDPPERLLAALQKLQVKKNKEKRGGI
jgi:DNA-binding NarL/FixJ family response regulator